MYFDHDCANSMCKNHMIIIFQTNDPIKLESCINELSHLMVHNGQKLDKDCIISENVTPSVGDHNMVQSVLIRSLAI